MTSKKNLLAAGASVLASLAGFSASWPWPDRYSDKIGPDGTRYDPTRTTSKRTKREHQARKRLAAQGFSHAMPVVGGYEGVEGVNS